MTDAVNKDPDPMDLALGAAIRIRRRIIGVTQEALAQKCGVTFQQVQKYESGQNRVSFSRLVRIAAALDCRVTELLAVLEVDETPNASVDLVATLSLPGAMDLLSAYDRMPTHARPHLVGLARAFSSKSDTADEPLETADNENVDDGVR